MINLEEEEDDEGATSVLNERLGESMLCTPTDEGNVNSSGTSWLFSLYIR